LRSDNTFPFSVGIYTGTPRLAFSLRSPFPFRSFPYVSSLLLNRSFPLLPPLSSQYNLVCTSSASIPPRDLNLMQAIWFFPGFTLDSLLVSPHFLRQFCVFVRRFFQPSYCDRPSSFYMARGKVSSRPDSHNGPMIGCYEWFSAIRFNNGATRRVFASRSISFHFTVSCVSLFPANVRGGIVSSSSGCFLLPFPHPLERGSFLCSECPPLFSYYPHLFFFCVSLLPSPLQPTLDLPYLLSEANHPFLFSFPNSSPSLIS